jgi:ribosomal protein S18 acetylase RimI-like enzyme
MLKATQVSTEDELIQIHKLNQANLKGNLTESEQKEQGFVTWLYAPDLLKKMNALAPSVIVKDGNIVAGYALTTTREAIAFHPDLKIMFSNLENVSFRGLPLNHYNFYCMGQICVAPAYRGKGVVNLLYEAHKKFYGKQYQFILTEISTSNFRSLKAHQNIGFETIYTYRDDKDEWNVVVWEWKEKSFQFPV